MATSLVAVGAVLGALVVASPSSAGVDNSLCQSSGSRLLADNFLLPVCFDGSTLVVRNDTNLPLHVYADGASGSPSRQAYGTVPPVSSFLVNYAGDSTLLVPGYQMRIPVGSAPASVRLGGADGTNYVVIRALLTILPVDQVVSLVDNVGSFTTELKDVWSKYQTCTANNGWLGDLGCEAIYDRDVAFAAGRFAVHLGSAVAGKIVTTILPLLDTAEWANDAAHDTIQLAEAQRSGGLALSITGSNGGGAPTPQPPGTSSSGPLSFQVTGSCTSSGGTLHNSSSGFTPGGSVHIAAWYPSGAPYTDLVSTGHVRDDGSATWDWPCAGDPAGTYTTQVTDSATGRTTERASFTIGAGSQPAPPPATYPETTGGVAHTWTNYTNAGGTEGPQIASNQTVQIACKLTGFKVPDGNTWWYRIAQSPWNNQYYVSADAFYNNGATSGSLQGTPFVDPNVANC
jgi:hypothetical protein